MEQTVEYGEYTPGGIRKRKTDWKKMLHGWVYNDLYFEGLPGWDLGVNGYQLEQMCYFVMGEGKQSRDIAIEFDDACKGMFYYADKTYGTPFVREGEEYVSFFAFQLTEDFLLFNRMFEDACSADSQEKAMLFVTKKYGTFRWPAGEQAIDRKSSGEPKWKKQHAV
jgi:hypothetical protein